MSNDGELITTALAIAVAVIDAVLSTRGAADPDSLESLRKDMELLFVKRCSRESLTVGQRAARELVKAARNGAPY